MQAMRARVTEPVSYQACQHFITHAPWDVRPVWRRLLAVLTERRGVLILDDTGFPKLGTHSVGVARQYSGTLGRIANCQVAVTAALWSGMRALLLRAELYLPDTWCTPERRHAARIPPRRSLSRETATGAHVDSPGTRGRPAARSGGGRCGPWR
jgi:SRSO17 transposase